MCEDCGKPLTPPEAVFCADCEVRRAKETQDEQGD